MKERILASLLMLCLFTAQVYAQAEVESMKETNDFIPGNDQRKDYNNQLCALVKVQVVDDITDVEGSVMGDIVHHGVEKWVYMAQGARNMKIHLRNSLPVRVMFKDYGINGLKSNRIYELAIVTELPTVDVPKEEGNNYVVFNVTPKNSIIYVDDNLYQPNEDGQLSIFLPYGIHNYRIDAVGGYESAKGTFEIGSKKVTKNISLKSQKARLTINASMPNTTIYVNDELKGENRWAQDMLPGIYKITAKLSGHREWSSTVSLEKNDQETISIPKLTPIYGSVNVDYSPNGSLIYIDGDYLGMTPLVLDQLIIGKHQLEISKKGYKTYNASFNLPEGKELLIMGELEALKTEPKPGPKSGSKPANAELVSKTQQETTPAQRNSSQQVEPINLGLSVMWSPVNFCIDEDVKTNTQFYAWGESLPKNKYTINNYAWGKGDISQMENIGENISGGEYDVVRKIWGGKWRIPTVAEMRELIEKCKFILEKDGVTFIGPNGQTLFLPACGVKGSVNAYKEEGFYWTASLDEKNGSLVYFLHFDHQKDKMEIKTRARFYGLTIRPVTE